ncbi:uridine kinase [Glaciecola sp. XM2]|jgi:uridine kinase|uniref:uridine kinase n=1 Tax=Glaciecola sp. XM2 TaxID=1914931 RepID=UPI001BDE4761|nr:uridine kinase [Glaciecola sp. XM2]MBT1450417.1 uridine kinase [Glaciecola sp. XM2]
MNQPTIIAISGASGSGKSLFTQNLALKLQQQDKHVLVLQEDHYYKSQDHIPLEQRVSTNYDHPDAFEHDLLSAHLQLLRDGETVEYPAYCYKTHTRLQETQTISPAPIIIIEGIMLLTQIHLFDHFNVKVFVDTALDVCLMRRMLRDTQERGRSMVSVAAQYENTVKPMYHKFIEPSKTFADLIVPHGGENLLAVDVLSAYLFNPQNGSTVNG